jgi:23S rRNA-intervening sequence protein
MGFKFEKLVVWQEAMRLGEDMYELTRKYPKEEMFNLTSQRRSLIIVIIKWNCFLKD